MRVGEGRKDGTLLGKEERWEQAVSGGDPTFHVTRWHPTTEMQENMWASLRESSTHQALSLAT